MVLLQKEFSFKWLRFIILYTYMEFFNSILNKEMVNHKKYKTFNEVKISLFEFIEGWYHNIRIHGSLNFMTPNQKYLSYLNSLQ